MTLRQEIDSLEYVKVPVSATVSGEAYDPTNDTVQMAFTERYTDPVSGDWKTADWEIVGSTYYARCLVGPGGTVTLTVGDYKVWVKITDNPEVPIKPAGVITIY
jgi:hypothetical protein